MQTRRRDVRLALGAAVLAVALIGCRHSPGPEGVVYVNCNALGSTEDGKSWSTAFRTVQEGIDAAAQGEGPQVWVAAGTYAELVYLKEGVLLYGGFAGSETKWEQRDWKRNVVILDGDRRGTVVTFFTSGSDPSCSTRIDGFTIQNGLDTGGLTGDAAGGGIHCGKDVLGMVTIENNLIAGNAAKAGGGICLQGSSVVKNNVIVDNHDITPPWYGGGIHCGGGAPMILSNKVTANSYDGILACASGVIANNVISDNQVTGLSVYGFTSRPDITNNTIVRNGYYGVLAGTTERILVANNVVAFNGELGFLGEQPELINNCVYWNRDEDYGSDIQPGAGDFSADPKFEADGYHLTSSSPCINAGSNTPVGWDDDIDREPRIYSSGGVVDVGADEHQGSGGGTVPSDVGVVDVTRPAGSVDSGWVETPSARIRNFSSHPLAVVFPVTIRIGSLYEATVQETIAGRDTLTVFFPDWTASAGGTQPIVCFTRLVGDGNAANDSAYDSVYVRPSGLRSGATCIQGAGHW